MHYKTPTLLSLSEEIAKLVELSKHPEFITEISEEDIRKAKGFAGMMGHSTHDFFVILSAINLLNAAVKLPEYKSQLHYGFIKGKVKRLLAHFVHLRIERFEIEFYINPEENCAYFEIYDLQFSFHNLALSDGIREFITSERNITKPWRQIRLQKIAGELFRLALKYK